MNPQLQLPGYEDIEVIIERINERKLAERWGAMRTTCKIGKYKPLGDGPLPPMRVGVLAEHDGILALSKPPCMFEWTCFWHRAGYPNQHYQLKELRPGIAPAHRIDGTTSGVTIWGYGGKGNARGHLTKVWLTDQVHKSYLAIVSDEPDFDYKEVTIQAPDGNGRPAWCTTGLTNLGDKLLRADLLDRGLNHQIRRALKSIGLPIAGDILYGGSNAAARPMLHAWRVTIDGWGEVKSPTPWDMPDYEDVDPFLWSYEVLPLSPEDQAVWEEHSQAKRKGNVPGWKWTRGRIFGPDGAEIDKPPAFDGRLKMGVA